MLKKLREMGKVFITWDRKYYGLSDMNGNKSNDVINYWKYPHVIKQLNNLYAIRRNEKICTT